MLSITKFHDLVRFHIAIFMFKYKYKTLPPVFESFKPVSEMYEYNTRSASKQAFHIPKARTNYGKFNIRFQGPKIWNSIEENLKSTSLSTFKANLKSEFIKHY